MNTIDIEQDERRKKKQRQESRRPNYIGTNQSENPHQVLGPKDLGGKDQPLIDIGLGKKQRRASNLPENQGEADEETKDEFEKSLGFRPRSLRDYLT